MKKRTSIASMGYLLNSDVVKRERVRMGMSQSAVAEAIECERSYLAYLENGTKQPSWDLLMRLASLWNLPPKALLVPASAEAALATVS